MATFYKNKNEVGLQPGQTLGFTAGKGYYAAGKPTPPKPPPSSSTPKKPTAEPTATQPRPAQTPTAPPKRPTEPRAPALTDRSTLATAETTSRISESKPPGTLRASESTPYYNRPGDVPLLPSQNLGFTGEKGYYAAGRPNPTKASATPNPSNVKVTAVSTRGSTVSPLIESVETDSTRTTVTLSHRANGDSAATRKPFDITAAPQRMASVDLGRRPARQQTPGSHKAAVRTRKASARVDEQLKRSRSDSSYKEVTQSIKEFDLAIAALAHGTKYKKDLGPYETAGYEADGKVSATVHSGVTVAPDNKGHFVVKDGDRTLYVIRPGKLIAKAVGYLGKAERAYTVAQDFRRGPKAATVPLDGGALSVTITADGRISITSTRMGITNTVTLGGPAIEIATVVSKPIGRNGASVDVEADLTLTKTGGGGPDDGHPVRAWEPEAAAAAAAAASAALALRRWAAGLTPGLPVPILPYEVRE